MIRILELKMENFGPYFGTEILSFPKEDGITIIWGENGYGKTTIMNAFRYVIWGTIYDRKRQPIPPSDYVNTLSYALDGDMMVELHMEYNNEDVIVSRGLKRITGDGKSPEDYEKMYSVKKGTHTLSKEESDQFLETIFPERIARFYLFDGELLSEYEDLLDEKSDTGQSIQKSIEDILGLPVLENALKNIRLIENDMGKSVDKLSKLDARTKTTSEDLEKNRDLLKHLNESNYNLKKKLSDLLFQRNDIETDMNNNGTLTNLIGQKKVKTENLENYTKQLESHKEEARVLMADSWRILLNSVINDAVSELENSIKELKEKETKSKVLETLAKIIDESLDKNPDSCPICGSGLSEITKKNIRNKFKEKLDINISYDDQQYLHSIEGKINDLKASISDSDADKISRIQDEIEQLSINIDLTEADIAQINSNIQNLGSTTTEEEAAGLATKYKVCTDNITDCKNGIKENEDHIADVQNSINKLEAIIKKNSNNPDVALAIKQREFATRLKELFEKSIDKFKYILKNNVQKDASEFFTKISNDNDYDHLQINDSYGLKIIDKNGEIVPHRSSGYEQVVAISLISALHKNAPIEGPIFMDSTFQRVDNKHKQKIIQNLPNFGHQVIVLAYETEMGDKEEIKSLLGSHLLKEYQLIHPESRKTKIN